MPPQQPDSADERRGILEDNRDALVAARDVAEPKEIAAISRELRQVLGELADLTPPTRSKTDELAEQRRRRRSEASKRAASGDNGGP